MEIFASDGADDDAQKRVCVCVCVRLDPAELVGNKHKLCRETRLERTYFGAEFFS